MKVELTQKALDMIEKSEIKARAKRAKIEEDEQREKGRNITPDVRGMRDAFLSSEIQYQGGFER